MSVCKTVRCKVGTVVLLFLAACTSVGPPVQEMSDARQAIGAAREAGAAELAVEGLRTAETQLSAAELQLQQGMYWDARKLAISAKEAAFDALLRARSSREPSAAPTISVK